MRASAIFIGAVLSNPCFAQNVQNVEAVASRATVVLAEGQYKSCGMRFVALAMDPQRPSFPAYGWDFNITVWNAGRGNLLALLKTEMSNVLGAERMTSAPLVKVVDTWLQVEGRDPVKAHKSGIPGENRMSSMTAYPVSPWADNLLDLAKGEPLTMLLGIRLDKERATRVFRFAPAVAEQDALAFTNCAVSLLKTAQADLERQQPR